MYYHNRVKRSASADWRNPEDGEKVKRNSPSVRAAKEAASYLRSLRYGQLTTPQPAPVAGEEQVSPLTPEQEKERLQQQQEQERQLQHQQQQQLQHQQQQQQQQMQQQQMQTAQHWRTRMEDPAKRKKIMEDIGGVEQEHKEQRKQEELAAQQAEQDEQAEQEQFQAWKKQQDQAITTRPDGAVVTESWPKAEQRATGPGQDQAGQTPELEEAWGMYEQQGYTPAQINDLLEKSGNYNSRLLDNLFVQKHHQQQGTQAPAPIPHPTTGEIEPKGIFEGMDQYSADPSLMSDQELMAIQDWQQQTAQKAEAVGPDEWKKYRNLPRRRLMDPEAWSDEPGQIDVNEPDPPFLGTDRDIRKRSEMGYMTPEDALEDLRRNLAEDDPAAEFRRKKREDLVKEDFLEQPGVQEKGWSAPVREREEAADEMGYVDPEEEWKAWDDE